MNEKRPSVAADVVEGRRRRGSPVGVIHGGRTKLHVDRRRAGGRVIDDAAEDGCSSGGEIGAFFTDVFLSRSFVVRPCFSAEGRNRWFGGRLCSGF